MVSRVFLILTFFAYIFNVDASNSMLCESARKKEKKKKKEQKGADRIAELASFK